MTLCELRNAAQHIIDCLLSALEDLLCLIFFPVRWPRIILLLHYFMLISFYLFFLETISFEILVFNSEMMFEFHMLQVLYNFYLLQFFLHL
jgi:hypothetical protein